MAWQEHSDMVFVDGGLGYAACQRTHSGHLASD